MTASYSADQFKYLIEDNPGNISMSVRAYHPETEREIAGLAVKVREYTSKAPKAIAQPQIKGAFVHPDYQRQGVGTELYDIATHHLGKQPMHDTSVTPEAQTWAAKVGGALHPEMETGMSFNAGALATSFERNRTEKYSEHLAQGHQPPKPRQMAFRGM